MRRQAGFNLIELVLSLLLLALGSVVVATQFGQGSRGLGVDETVQTAAQLAQRCAEHLIETRRRNGYAGASAATCPALPAAMTSLGYTQSLNLAPIAGGPCPTGVDCLRARIQVLKQGAPQSELTLLLAEY